MIKVTALLVTVPPPVPPTGSTLQTVCLNVCWCNLSQFFFLTLRPNVKCIYKIMISQFEYVN